jgi:hypothetical protein
MKLAENGWRTRYMWATEHLCMYVALQRRREGNVGIHPAAETDAVTCTRKGVDKIYSILK